MKIAATTLGCDGGLSGIGRYASTLLERWTYENEDLSIYGHDSDRKAFIPSGRKVNWHSVPEYWKEPLPSVLWHQVMLPHLARKADVLFLPAGNRRLPITHTVPSVGTVHDCSSFHVAGKYDRARDLYIKRVLPWMMQRLDHVITVSESRISLAFAACALRTSRSFPWLRIHQRSFPGTRNPRRFGSSSTLESLGPISCTPPVSSIRAKTISV